MMLSELSLEEEEVVQLLEVFWTGTGTWGSRDDVGLPKRPHAELTNYSVHNKKKYITIAE